MVLNRCPKCGTIMTQYMKYFVGRPVIFEKCDVCGYNTETGPTPIMYTSDKTIEIGGKSPWVE